MLYFSCYYASARPLGVWVKSKVAKILLVEDDSKLSATVTSYLTSEGHTLEAVNCGEDAMQILENFTFDLIILDWHLPGISGLEVCRRFRKAGRVTSIIFLTGVNDLDSKEDALDAGGDDYLTKPFEARELAARIRSVLRRSAVAPRSELRVGNVQLFSVKRAMTVNAVEYYLAPKECALLEYLMRHPNCAFSAESLLNAVWPSEGEGTAASVRSWMRILRRKFEAAGEPEFIKTIQNSGYIIEEK